MEDSSLDDFFAKKDKTKKKNKSKLTPSDILAQQETGSTKKSKKKKDKENEATSEERKATNVMIVEDDENWVDFEAETETDYSGLRIQNLQLANKEEGEEEEEVNENEDEEDGETKQKKEEISGPWNKSSGTQPQQQTPQPVVAAPEPPPPQPEAPKEEESKPKKYVPPGARSSMSGSPAAGTPSRLTARKKRAAPNLQSEDDFPTLGGGGAPEVRSWGNTSDSRGDFERVQSGGRNIDDPNKVSQQLTLGNRYSSLQD